MSPFNNSVFLVVLNLDLYIGLHLRCVVQITLGSSISTLSCCLVFHYILTICAEIWITKIAISGHCCWPALLHLTHSTNTLRSRTLSVRHIFFKYVVPNRDVFSFDDMNHDLAFPDILKRYSCFGPHDWLKLPSCLEQFVKDSHECVLIIVEELFFPYDSLITSGCSFSFR